MKIKIIITTLVSFLFLGAAFGAENFSSEFPLRTFTTFGSIKDTIEWSEGDHPVRINPGANMDHIYDNYHKEYPYGKCINTPDNDRYVRCGCTSSAGAISWAKQILTKNIQFNYSDYNLKCEKITAQILVDKMGGGIFAQDLYYFTTHLFCLPRNFQDQALIGLQGSCSKKPQADCFNPDLLQKINNIKPVLIDLNPTPEVLD